MITKELRGLLGGIGAYASSYIYQKSLDYTRNKKHDNDYPNLLIYNLPCNHLKGDNFDTEEAREEIEQGLDVLRKAGCEKIWIGCNSVHSFINKINNHKVINWTPEFIKSAQKKDVLLLASNHTKESKFYELNTDKTILYPTIKEQKEIEQMIDKAITNRIHNQEITKFQQILNKYNQFSIAIACTELSIVYSKINHKYSNVIDSCEYIAKEISI